MNRSARSLALSLVLLAAALPARAAAADTVTFQYFAGKSETFLPSGRSLGTQDALVERIIDPARLTITERVLGPDHQHPTQHSEFIVNFAVAPAQGTMVETERSHAFNGTGTLTGDLWKWTGWHTSSHIPGGIRVESSDQMGQGTLVAKKEIYGADGKLMIRMTETYAAIDAAEFERTYYRWRLQ